MTGLEGGTNLGGSLSAAGRHMDVENNPENKKEERSQDELKKISTASLANLANLSDIRTKYN